MKKYLPNILGFLIVTICVIGLFSLSAHGVHAAEKQVDGAGESPSFMGMIMGLFTDDLKSFVDGIIAYSINKGVEVMGFLMALSGWVLNFSINLTLQIKQFVDGSTVVYSTWRAIRDISGLFVIFMLLWAALQFILGIENQAFGKLVKDIVIVGILINFSFFFASIGIDASNIVSVQLYNAIAPANSLNPQAANSNVAQNAANTGRSVHSKLDGGISDIFMSALKIQTISKDGLTAGAQGAGGASGGPTYMSITIIGGVVSIIVELFAALSFLAAAVAFIFRFVVLIVLLAFSPIWIASRIIPQTKTYAAEWSGTYVAMLTFMPVYLLLMYLSMNVILHSGLSTNFGVTGTTSWFSQFVIVGVNAFIIFFFINMPLLVAGKMAGIAKGAMDKTVGVSKWLGGWVGTRTVGKWSSDLNKKLEGSSNVLIRNTVGNSLLGKGIRGATVGALAKNKMAYTYSNDERVKELKEIGKKTRENKRNANLERVLDEAQYGKPHTTIDPITKKPHTPSTVIKSMTEKEKIGAVGGAFKDKNNAQLREILKHVKGSDFDAIKKSDDVLDEDKGRIGDLRKEALSEALTKKQTDAVKNMVENMDGKDLLKLDKDVLTNPEVVKHLKQSQLKTMAEEGIEVDTKKRIGNMIDTWFVAEPHKSQGFINKNRKEWTTGGAASSSSGSSSSGSSPASSGPTMYDAYGRPIP